MALLDIARTPKPKPGAASKQKAAGGKEWAVTTIRFRPETLAALKKAAIDRGESFQEMVEQALIEMLLDRDGAKVPGLRRQQ